MLVDLGFTAIPTIFFFSPATLGARWTELNQTWPHAQR